MVLWLLNTLGGFELALIYFYSFPGVNYSKTTKGNFWDHIWYLGNRARFMFTVLDEPIFARLTSYGMAPLRWACRI